jgi:hypothetical protein
MHPSIQIILRLSTGLGSVTWFYILMAFLHIPCQVRIEGESKYISLLDCFTLYPLPIN